MPTETKAHRRLRVLAAGLASADGTPMPEPAIPGGARLSVEQKLHLVKHGFVIIRGAVPMELIKRCRDRMEREDPRTRPAKGPRYVVTARDENGKPGGNLATCSEVLDCFNQSSVKQMLRQDMGPFSPVLAAQVAITPAGVSSFGGEKPACHVDGTWGGAAQPFPRGMQLAPMEGMRPECLRPVDPELRIKFFGNDETETVSPLQTGVLWQDREQTVSLGSYTCLVGIALNDQRQAGKGQFGVYAGMHEHIQQFFRKQRDMGGPIGPDGPGWPRLTQDSKGNTFLGNGIPPELHKIAQSRTGIDSDVEGWPWPELTPCLLAPGDAVIALHSCPHTPTPNFSDEPRMNLYFRIRRFRKGDPNEGSRRLGHGVSDHLDRGAYGQWLDYPEGYDPIKISVDAMCDHWSEWDGIDPEEVLAGKQ